MTSSSKTVMKLNKIRAFALPDFKANSKAAVIKIVCYLQKYISGNEKNLEINSHVS